MNHKNIYNIAYKLILSAIIIILFMIIGSFKSGYHVDEMYTFGLANLQCDERMPTAPPIEDETVYTGQQLWQEYTTVSPQHTFDYGNVSKNQSRDVHPPLYYCIIHTVCSFLPNTFSIWMGLIVNILLSVIVFWQMVWLFEHFIGNRYASLIFSLLFLFTMGFINSVVFFRMYVLLAVWTNALTILLCKYEPQDKDKNFYISLTFILIGGTMTQYYFIIYAFFSCLVYAVFVVMQKNWKKLAFSLVSVGISISICSCIFPAMWKHIFKGYQGTAAFENMAKKGLWKSLWNDLDIINLQVFGNLFLFLFFFLLVLYITGKGHGYGDIIHPKYRQYLLLFIPSICYLILIAKISPYDTDRYIMNIMGILYLIMFTLLIQAAARFSAKAISGVMIAAVLVLVCSYRDGIPYLYREKRDNVKTIEALDKDIDCLYLYDRPGKTVANYLELTDLEQITFIGNDNLESLGKDIYHHYDELLVFIIRDLDTDSLLQQLLDANSGLEGYTKLFSAGYADVYYLN